MFASDIQTVNININPISPLHQLKKQVIYDLRKSKVNIYKKLKIFPEHYIPDRSIFGQIDEKFDWVYDTQFFVVNPYLLVLTSAGNKVNALLPYCSVKNVEYSKNRISVNYKNQSALKWFYYLYDYYSDSKGIVRLWFVNAYDAGFKYVHVDVSRSINIKPVPNSTTDNVLKGVYSGHEFFHVGHLNKNNISSDDPRAKLRLRKKNEKTVIYVKLWKSRPENLNSKEDFAYIINIEP